MNQRTQTSLLVAGVLLLFGAIGSQPAHGQIVSSIDGNYTISPSLLSSTPPPVSFSLTNGAVSSPSSLAGDTVSQLDFTLNTDGSITLTQSQFIITSVSVDPQAVFNIVSPATITSDKTSNTASISAELSLVSNNLGVDLSALQTSLLTMDLTNVQVEPQWPVGGPSVGVTFSIVPIPEPTSLVLWGVLGGAGLVWLRRRRSSPTAGTAVPPTAG